MSEKNFISLTCPYCGKIYDTNNSKNPKGAMFKHSIKCKSKHDFIQQFGWTKEKLEKELEDLGSVSEFIRKYIPLVKNYSIGNTNIREIFKEFGIDTSIKRATNHFKIKEKRKKTNLKRYGCPHNFCKESESRKKWEQRLLEEEGITNVFQRKDVQEKSEQTSLKKYGVKHPSQSNLFKVTEKYCIRKYGEEKGKQMWDKIKYDRGKSSRYEYYIEKYGDEAPQKWAERFQSKNKHCNSKSSSISSLNKIIEEFLNQNNIEFESEFVLWEINYHPRYYDFKIGNVLIELNGTFWHADPRKYKETDILKFPGTDGILAKDIWEKDKIKKNLALDNGYQIIYYWESEITNKNEFDKIKEELINYAISENKINKKDSN